MHKKCKSETRSNFYIIKSCGILFWVCQNLLVPGRADLVGFEVEVISDVDLDDVAVLVVVVVVLVDCCLVVVSSSPVPPECVGGGRSPYNDDILF